MPQKNAPVSERATGGILLPGVKRTRTPTGCRYRSKSSPALVWASVCCPLSAVVPHDCFQFVF